MLKNAQKLTRLANTFLILAIIAFFIGNLLAALLYYAFFSTTQSYSPETIQDPLASMALLGEMLAQVVGCTMTAGIGNLLSIVFTTFSLSFSSKAYRACRQPRNAVKTVSVILLIISIIAFILTLPTYFLLSFFLGI